MVNLALLLLCFLSHSSLSWAGVQQVQEVNIHQSSSLILDRIDIQGVKAVSSNVIEGGLELLPGDRLNQQKIESSRKNLIKIYQDHGYEDASVEVRVFKEKLKQPGSQEVVLEIRVKEGQASRVAAVEVNLSGADRVDLKDLKSKELKDLHLLVPIHVGDALDQDNVSDGKKAIQDKLSSLDYVGSSILAVQVIPSHEPQSVDPSKSDLSSTRWVKLQYQIKLGEKVWFGFQGQSFLTWAELNRVVDDQKAIGLGQDYMETLRRRIEEEYRSQGFFYARVEAISASLPGRLEQRVTFLISEGPRARIESIEFDGNMNFISRQLRDLFYSKASSVIQNQIFVEKEVQKAGELLIDILKEQGYLGAKLVTIHSVFPEVIKPKSSQVPVRVTLYLYEGEQTKVTQFRVEGLNHFSFQDIAPVFKVHEGDPLNLFELSKNLEELKSFYRSQGYLDFQILNEGSEDIIVYSREHRNAEIHLKINEGVLSRVSRIEIKGVARTQESVILDQLLFKVNDILTENNLIETERNLRRLGIFSSLNMRLVSDPGHEGSKAVVIKVQEADRGVLTWGPGLRTDLGIRAFSQLSYMNLWGRNHTVAISLNFNRRFYNYHFPEVQGQLSYIWPKFASVQGLVYKPSLTGGRTQYFDFAAETFTLASTWEKPLVKNSHLLGSFTYTLESTHQFNSNLVSDNQTYRIGTVTPRLTLDLRDSALSPNRGFYTTVWADFAFPMLGSGSVAGLNGQSYSISYYRAQLRADYHLPLFNRFFWYFSLRSGYEKTTQNIQPGDTTTSLIPLIKQFALGGIASLRGYRELELNYQSQNIPIQNSLSYINYRTQLDYAFSDAVRFGVFMDAANLLIDQYSFGRLYYTTGAGLHIQTPVGPVNLDWGFKLNQNPNSLESNFVHFSVGVI